MKRKIISLILAALCLVTVLASCSDDKTNTEPPVTCTGHVDADLNSACDNCGCPVLTIVKDVPAEEAVVEQIVSSIPADATIVTIYDCTAPANDTYIISTTPENLVADWTDAATRLSGDIYVITYEISEETEETWYNPVLGADEKVVKVTETTRVIDFNTGDDLITPLETTYALHKAAEEKVSYGVYAVNTAVDETVGFAVACAKYNATTTVTYYTLGGTEIATTEAIAIVLPTYDDYTKYAYLEIDETVYVVSLEDNSIVYSAEDYKFVNRPYFDTVNEEKAYGFVERGNYVYVYNTNEWIDCIYAYEIQYTKADVYYLANGNILIQARIEKPDSAVNYDVAISGTKYDIKYIVVDVAAKTEKEIEFGYYIDYVYPVDDPSYIDTVKNKIECRKIINKDVNTDMITLLTDDELTIIANADKVLPNAQIIDFYKIAENRFIGTVEYSDTTTVDKLYNEKGEELAILPNAYALTNDFIVINDKEFYDYDMNLIFDAGSEEYADKSVLIADDYILISDDAEGKIYYVKDAKMELVVVAEDSEEKDESDNVVKDIDTGIEWINDSLFIIWTRVEENYDADGNLLGTPAVTRTYEVYNSNNELVYTADSGYKDAIIGDESFLLLFENGNAMLF